MKSPTSGARYCPIRRPAPSPTFRRLSATPTFRRLLRQSDVPVHVHLRQSTSDRRPNVRSTAGRRNDRRNGVSNSETSCPQGRMIRTVSKYWKQFAIRDSVTSLIERAIIYMEEAQASLMMQ